MSTIRLLLYVACGPAVLLAGALGGCPNAGSGDGGAGPGPAGTPSDTGGAPNSPDESNAPTANGGNSTGSLMLSGRINPAQAAKHYPRLQGTEGEYPYTLVATSDQTGEVYRADTDPSGEFSIDIPDSEAGNSLVVAVVAPDGHALGPILVDQTAGDGVTGVAMDQPADLGTVSVPDDPSQQPISAGSDGNAAELADPGVYTRLNESGAPLGVDSVGKDQDAVIDASQLSGAADQDHDGLVDGFDADSTRSGVVDDLKPDAEIGAGPADCYANFFMGLHVEPEYAQTYYAGTPDEVAARLKVDTRIHLGVGTNNLATRQITAARLLETPGPAYLPTAVYAGPDGPDTRTLREDGYVLENEGTHPGAPGHGPSWGVHLIPLEVMQAGDIFTIEMTFDTGEVGQYSRMINYVFKSIPRLVRAGAAGSLHDFDVTDPAMNGTPEHPILFDGTQDLVLVFNPPKDETGAYITGMDYHIEVFFVGSGPGAGQLSLDFAAT